MTSTWERLKTAFINDHQAMTRRYVDLLKAVQLRNFAAASQIASELDQRAGPHIEFEEQCLYPQVKPIRGEEYTSRLYQEHRDILDALVELKSLPPTATPDEAQIAKWSEQIQHGLDHAAACGSLLSHLQTQPTEQQQQNLESLEQLQKQRHCWSELPRSAEKSA